MINLEKKKHKGFWIEAVEFLLDLFSLPFKLIWLMFKGLWWCIKGIGHISLFLLEVTFEFLGDILDAIFSGW